MPHIDELLGSVTFAAAGLAAAIALQPVPHPAPVMQSTAKVVSADADGGRMVRMAPVEVVARRSVELARIEREDRLARERLTRDTGRPDA